MKGKKKATLAQEMRKKMATVEDVEKKLKLLAAKVREDILLLQGQITNVSELVQSVVYILEGKLDPPNDDGSLDAVITRPQLEQAHQALTKLWTQERMDRAKAQLRENELLCLKCLGKFTEGSLLKLQSGGHSCPRCKHSLFYSKKEQLDDLLSQHADAIKSDPAPVGGGEGSTSAAE